MQELRFGVAGLKDTKDLTGSVGFLLENGYTACEVQFVKEFTLKEPEVRLLGQLCGDAGIRLSVHAPYFAQLTSADPGRLKLHLGALHHSCKLAAAMGGHIVVCHPGSRGEAGPEELFETVDRALEDLGPRVEDTGVKLGLETCGRRSQFGSVGDIAALVSRHAFCAPVIDYAHIHALSNGSLGSPEALKALFSYVTESFSWDQLWPLHTHFSDNAFGPAGETKHVPYGEGSMRIGNVYEGARDFDLSLTVISEQKEIASHAAIKAELEAMGAPLVSLRTPAQSSPAKRQGPGIGSPIPLEPAGEFSWFQKGPRRVRLTHLDKIYFPDDGLTKGDLVDYYYNAAPLMLKFLKDRPVNMHRLPEGIYGEAFYEKQAPKGAPDWLATVPVRSGSQGGRTIDFIVVDDVTALVYMAQMGSIECHAWTSRRPNLEEPDFAVLDLDPHEPIEFSDVQAVARLAGVVFEQLGLKAFPKTSGGAGLQIFVPLAPGHTYPEVRRFCSQVGALLKAAYPEKVTMEPSKPRRAGKVYVDVDQNAKGQTLVAPYSARPYPGAPVSTPLAWAELEDDFLPEQFTITTVFERVQRLGDPFKSVMSVHNDLHPVLEKLNA